MYLMTDPGLRIVEDTLAAVFEFKSGMILPGCLALKFDKSSPLEVNCVFRAFRATDAVTGAYLEGEWWLERDAMVRATLLPGLKMYGTGDYRIGRVRDDMLKVFLEVDPRSTLEGADYKATCVCSLSRRDMVPFLEKTMALMEIGSDSEQEIILSDLDNVLEKILSDG